MKPFKPEDFTKQDPLLFMKVRMWPEECAEMVNERINGELLVDLFDVRLLGLTIGQIQFLRNYYERVTGLNAACIDAK